MSVVLEVTNLNYQDFKNINLVFYNRTFYSIVGGSNSGKTTLFKLLTSLIPINNVINSKGIFLNDDTIDEYIVRIGIVERLHKHSFLFKRVIDEAKYPLHNLGYSKKMMMKRINLAFEHFNVSYLLDKDISELNSLEKQKLLIIISLLHQPRVLLLDSVFDSFPKEDRIDFIKKLKILVSRGLTVINFTKELDFLMDKIILLDNYSVIGEYEPSKIYEDDKLFYSHNLEIPFISDLAVKLKVYGLLDKNYTNMKAMVDDLWP